MSSAILSPAPTRAPASDVRAEPVAPARSDGPTPAAVLSAAAGVLHLLVAQAHAGEPWLLLGFVAIGALQLLPLVATRTGTALRDELLLTVNLAAIGAWVVSRTVGLPSVLGGGGPEALGRADVVVLALQVLAVAALLRPGRAAGPGTHAVAPSAVVLIALGAVAFAAPGATVHDHGSTIDLDRLGLLGPNDLIGRSPLDASPGAAMLMKERMTGLDANGDPVGPAYAPVEHDGH